MLRHLSRKFALVLCLALVFCVVILGVGKSSSLSSISQSLSWTRPPGSASRAKEVDDTEKVAGNRSVQFTDVDVYEDPSLPSHRVLFSASTLDREFMHVYLGGVPGSNINIIAHPSKIEFWILIAQRDQEWGPPDPEQKATLEAHGITEVDRWPDASKQVACTAGIQNEAVICAGTAAPIPFLGPQADGNCVDRLAFVSSIRGSRDARVFYGPDIPYMVFGAKSEFICFGQWLQDARFVLPEFKPNRHMNKDKSPFRKAVELQRPSDSEYGPMEKNYFLFWDTDQVAYVHYALWPQRAFSRLNDDGTGSSDLAPASNYHDQICMAKYMPLKRLSRDIHIHQATNSLSITMCKRSDPRCQPNDSNTFIMHIFHYKTYYQYHAVYEPYVVLMRRYAPFAIHAIGQRPFWIHGRHNLTEASESAFFKDRPLPKGHTEMFYITSMNWKSHAQRYHGYMDDVLFLSFGIEDTKPGIIDVLAGDLLEDLAYC